MILHIPHSSTGIPGDLRSSLLVSDAELREELIAMTDHLTDLLFESPGAARVVYPVSRLVVDPERFLEDAQEPMAARGMGVVYEVTSKGARLRDLPTTAQRKELVDRFYVPHHEALADAADRLLETDGDCLLLDCHSFPSRARAFELNPTAPRPEICLGTDSFHTPPELVAAATAAFDGEGFTVEVDSPYRGTLVPARHYRRQPLLRSLMIEVNRGLYLDELTGLPLAAFEETRRRISRALARLA